MYSTNTNTGWHRNCVETPVPTHGRLIVIKYKRDGWRPADIALYNKNLHHYSTVYFRRHVVMPDEITEWLDPEIEDLPDKESECRRRE